MILVFLVVYVYVQLRDAFYDVEEQLRTVSEWKSAIIDEPCDVQFLVRMRDEMDLRQELWQYFDVSTLSIREWKEMFFKKVDVEFQFIAVMT